MYKFINDLSSFQNGVDVICNGCTTYGSTPTASTPNAIVTAISNIYTNRYNSGITQGRSDVKNNPGNYSLIKQVLYGSDERYAEPLTTTNYTVTFTTPFTGTPTVKIWYHTSSQGNGNFTGSLVSVSKTSFTWAIKAHHQYGGYGFIGWCAWL